MNFTEISNTDLIISAEMVIISIIVSMLFGFLIGFTVGTITHGKGDELP